MELWKLHPFFVNVIGKGGEWPLTDLNNRPREELPFAIGKAGGAAAFFLCLAVILAIPLLRTAASRWPFAFGGAFREFLQGVCPYSYWSEISIWSNFTDSSRVGREVKRKRWIVVYAGSWFLLTACLALIWFDEFWREGVILDSRMRNLLNGVNPLVPAICFAICWMAFAWMRIRGRYLDNYSFHVLPSGSMIAPDKLRNDLISFSQEGFSFWGFAATVSAFAVVMCLYGLYPRDIEPSANLARRIAWSVAGLVPYSLAVYGIVHFLRLWLLLKRILKAIEAHPIRNAFTRLPERVSWTSIWSIGGLAPEFVSLQLATDYLRVLPSPRFNESGPNSVNLLRLSDDFLELAEQGQVPDGNKFAVNASASPDLLSPSQIALRKIVEESQLAAQHFVDRLELAWTFSALEGWMGARSDWTRQKDAKDHYLLGSSGPLRNEDARDLWKDKEKLKEEYLATLFCSYIRYVFAQMRNLAGFIATSVSLVIFGFTSYPFQPHGSIMNAISFLFVLLAAVFIVVFQQMDRDAILSRLSDTSAGKLDAGFATRLIQFGLLPSLTFVAGQIPGLSDLLLKFAEVVPGFPK